MKKLNPNFTLGVTISLVIVAGFFSNNLFSIVFMSLAVMQVGTLIEDPILKKKVVIIFGLITIFTGILSLIALMNHGMTENISLKNIF